MKECNKCKQVLALDMFNKDKTRQDGLANRCKQCQKLDNKQWHSNNSEWQKQYLKQWNKENSKHIKQHHKQYYQENIEQYKQSHKQWYQDNPEYMKQYSKQYHLQLPPGVYMVKCLVNGKRYIGESVKPVRRRCEHFSNCKTAKSLKTTNASLQADIKLYGKDKFVFGIVEYCEPEQLLEREQYYINLYKPEYN